MMKLMMTIMMMIEKKTVTLFSLLRNEFKMT